ncbi:unnamed protein product [Peronospora belbahrii]|uniref:Uncharacterized protein n=1 Tax=Peronospora belbahrii TaxID=622444 RepID=A0ABN8CZY1_9STRA|nr:unnamed protein product [Peronospora belbahrii]
MVNEQAIGLVTEAFTMNDVNETEMIEEEKQKTMMRTRMDKQDACLKFPQQSTLQTTLGVASFAASYVLFPYIYAGKAAVHATSTVMRAPIYLTNQVRASIVESWTRSRSNHVDTDTFEEDLASDTSTVSDVYSDNEEVMESLLAEKVTSGGQEISTHESGVISQLLYLPVRLVQSSVSTAVAIPTQVVTYSGQKISGAVSASHALATSAVVASTDGVARTGMHVARGITNGAVSTASFTASIISGAVGASVRTVSYAILPSVSNVVWQGMDITGNASVNMLSHAIAVPSYRMLRALVPTVSNCFLEEDVVNETKVVIKMLVKLLGPQNAFYLLKWAYETANSEEAHDAFLLCRDILHESLDGKNYRIAGASVGAATGFTRVVHVMKEAYTVLPSFDELLDAAVLVADISDEVVDGVTNAVAAERSLDPLDECRFEYVDDDEELWAQGIVEPTDTTFEYEESTLSSGKELNSLFNSGLSLLARACDSEEASSLFNTFGDFLDVLVD